MANGIAGRYQELLAAFRQSSVEGYDTLIVRSKAYLEEAHLAGDQFYIAKGHYMIAFLHDKQNRLAEGLAHYLEAAQSLRHTDNKKARDLLISTYKNAAIVLFACKSYALSWDFYEKAKEVARQANNQTQLFELADIRLSLLVEDGDYESVVSLVDSLLQIDAVPKSLKYWYYYRRGLAHSRLKNYEQAVADYERAIADPIEPNEPYFYYSLMNASSVYAEDLRNFDRAHALINQALIFYQQGVYNKEQLFEAEYFGGGVFLYAGEYDSASTLFHQAMALVEHEHVKAPEYYLVYKEMAELQSVMGNVDSVSHYQALYLETLGKETEKNEEVRNLHLQKNLEQIAKRYFDLQRAEDEKASMREQAGIAIVLLVLLCLLLGAGLVYMHLKHRHRKSLASHALRELDALSDI